MNFSSVLGNVFLVIVLSGLVYLIFNPSVGARFLKKMIESDYIGFRIFRIIGVFALSFKALESLRHLMEIK